MFRRAVKQSVSWLLDLKGGEQAGKQAIKLYNEGHYNEAKQAFLSLATRYPHQEKTALTYLRKIPDDTDLKTIKKINLNNNN